MLETESDIIRLELWGFYLKLIKAFNELLGKEKFAVSIKSFLVNRNINSPKYPFTYLIPFIFIINGYKAFLW